MVKDARRAVDYIKLAFAFVVIVLGIGLALFVGFLLFLRPMWPALKKADDGTALAMGGIALAGAALWTWMKFRKWIAEAETQQAWWSNGCTSDCHHFSAEPVQEQGQYAARCAWLGWSGVVRSLPPSASSTPGPEGELQRELLRVFSATCPPCLTKDEIEDLKRNVEKARAQASGTTISG